VTLVHPHSHDGYREQYESTEAFRYDGEHEATGPRFASRLRRAAHRHRHGNLGTTFNSPSTLFSVWAATRKRSVTIRSTTSGSVRTAAHRSTASRSSGRTPAS